MVGAQEEAMDLDQLPLVSADSHVEEPSKLWLEGVPAKLRASLLQAPQAFL